MAKDIRAAEQGLLEKIVKGEISIYDAVAQHAVSPLHETRVSVKARAGEVNPELEVRDLETLNTLPEVVTSFVEPKKSRVLNQDEVDALIGEFITAHTAISILQGRLSGLKGATQRAIKASKIGDDERAYISSAVHGKKIERDIRGNKPYINPEILKEHVSAKVFKTFFVTVTTTSSTVDSDGNIVDSWKTVEDVFEEDRVTKALAERLITLDQLTPAVQRTEVTYAFTPRPYVAES